MSKYNYFDDLPLIYPGDEPQSSENVKVGAHKTSARSASLTPRGISADSARAAVEKIMQSEVIDEVKEIGSLPNLRARLLKLTAFLLALIAVAVFIFAFSRTISSQNDKINKFYADAGKVCTDYIKSYGTVKWEPMDEEIYGEGMTRLTGLCYARQMDFDRDGSDELMLCYNNRNVFTLEVWGYKGKDFIKLYGDEANKTADPKDGSRISFFYKNNKYYICKSEPDSPENIKMYALKGDSFKESGECLYDWKNNIYTIDGVINAQDFETINLSVIKSSKAEQIVNIVSDNIDSFHTVSVPAINTQKTDAELKADAYYAVIETRNDKYGEASVENKGGSKYLDGLCYASLIDFDNDENDELVLVYRKMVKESATNAYNGEFIIIENPAYCIEVYGWNGTAAKKIFSRDSVSNYLNDSDTNYLIIRHNENNTSDLCFNSYNSINEQSYSASSRIYSLKDGELQSVFHAREENSYGYKSYYLDGEYSYRSEFMTRAFKVPKFLDDSQTYDKNKFTMIYFSGDESSDYEKTADETVKTIQSLNKNYSPGA